LLKEPVAEINASAGCFKINKVANEVNKIGQLFVRLTGPGTLQLLAKIQEWICQSERAVKQHNQAGNGFYPFTLLTLPSLFYDLPTEPIQTFCSLCKASTG